MNDMRGSRIVCARSQVFKNTSDYLKMNQDELVSKDAQISIIPSAHEQKSKQKARAQTRSVKNLHELVTEMWSVRAVQYKNTVKHTIRSFLQTNDTVYWIPTFFPRLNMTVGEKKLDPEILFR